MFSSSIMNTQKTEPMNLCPPIMNTQRSEWWQRSQEKIETVHKCKELGGQQHPVQTYPEGAYKQAYVPDKIQGGASEEQEEACPVSDGEQPPAQPVDYLHRQEEQASCVVEEHPCVDVDYDDGHEFLYNRNRIHVYLDGDLRLIDLWVNKDDFKMLSNYPKALAYRYKLGHAIAVDDVIQFRDLIRDEQRVGTVLAEGVLFFPSLFLYITVRMEAIKCATALLDGTAGLEVDVNTASDSYDLPIIVAATHFLPEMVKLLDRFGAEFDIPSPTPSSYHLMLPLQAAIAHLSSMIPWLPGQSLGKLILSLLSYSERELLTISLVMRKTPVVETRRAIISYESYLDIVRLAILLCVDATSEHLRILKQISYEEYFLLLKYGGNIGMNFNIVDIPQAVNFVKLLLTTFYEENFERAITAILKMA